MMKAGLERRRRFVEGLTERVVEARRVTASSASPCLLAPGSVPTINAVVFLLTELVTLAPRASSLSPGSATTRLMKSCSGRSGNWKTMTSPWWGGSREKSQQHESDVPQLEGVQQKLAAKITHGLGSPGA